MPDVQNDKLKTYKVNDETEFDQRPLVAGQVQMIMTLLKGLVIPDMENAADLLQVDLLTMLGDKAIEFCTCILLPHDTPAHKVADWAAHRTDVRWQLPLEMVPDVVADFLELSLTSSFLNRLNVVASQAMKSFQAEKPQASTASSPTSQKETSPATKK